MLISLTNLAAMHKIQKNIWNKVRLVSLININTKEWQNKPPFMKVVYYAFCHCFVHQHGRLITWVKTKNTQSCTLTFSKSVFVGFSSPRSDEKRLTFRDFVAYSSFARSSQLVNNRLCVQVCALDVYILKICDSENPEDFHKWIFYLQLNLFSHPQTTYINLLIIVVHSIL